MRRYASLLAVLAAASITLASASGLPENFHEGTDPAWTSFCVAAGGLRAQSGVIAGCHAFGYFTDKIDSTGWSYLHVESDPLLPDREQAYAAGFAEGYLTSERTKQSLMTSFEDTFTNGTVPPAVYGWLTHQSQWIAAQVAENRNDSFWTQTQFVYEQITGMADGCRAAGYAVSVLDLLVHNAIAEAPDIMLALNTTLRDEQDPIKMNDFNKAQAAMLQNSHCSALIRLAPDGSDIFAAHTTWTSYRDMLRTYKYIKVAPFGTRSTAVQFSSYPGTVSSIDDFYQTSEGLIVTETTNDVANMSLYSLLNYTSVPTFVRVSVANRVAADGQTWTELFARENSGTYNNQWMVLDTKAFSQHQPPRANTLWILSQFPGGTRTLDATPVLTRIGSWTSYNIPYFPDVWELLGYGELVKKYGADGEYLWSYGASFRHLIFTRDAPQVSDLAGMQAIIQENKWQTDPLSRGSSQLAIASRADLGTGPLHPRTASGAIDAKVSSARLMALSASGLTGSMGVLARSGPTTDSQTPFTWSTSPFADLSHYGQPDTFNFAWQNITVIARPAAVATSLHSKAAAAAPVAAAASTRLRAAQRIALE